MGTVSAMRHGHDSGRDLSVTVKRVDGIERTHDPQIGQTLKEHIEQFNVATTGISEWRFERVGKVTEYPRGHGFVLMSKPLSPQWAAAAAATPACAPRRRTW